MQTVIFAPYVFQSTFETLECTRFEKCGYFDVQISQMDLRQTAFELEIYRIIIFSLYLFIALHRFIVQSKVNIFA